LTEVKAYAKINLFLDIEGIRDDGFHNIVSYMQTVSLHDTLILEKRESGIDVIGNYAVEPEKDLSYRAAKLFFEEYGICGGVGIKLEKRIPMQGGLGGGSADAAAVLRGLAHLYEVDARPEQLAFLGQRLGSDVPFCVVGGSKRAYGRGEILKDAPRLSSKYGIVIIAGKSGASTPAQFAALDRIYNNFKDERSTELSLQGLCDSVEKDDPYMICSSMYNIFEDTAAFDKEGVEMMKEFGAYGGMMTGSGSSAFCLFDCLEKAKKSVEKLTQIGRTAFACVPIDDINS